MADLMNDLRTAHIPFPQRIELREEIQRDMEADGRYETSLRKCDIDELAEIHSTTLFRWFSGVGNVGKAVAVGLAYVPVFILTITMFKEDTMIEFMVEGGWSMYAILAVGGFLLGRELLHAFRLLVVKDHRDTNLDLPTSTFLLLCFGLVLLGAGSSFLDFYTVLDKLADGGLASESVVIGFKESLAPMLLCLFFVSGLLFIRAGTRTLMHKWRAPLPA